MSRIRMKCLRRCKAPKYGLAFWPLLSLWVWCTQIGHNPAWAMPSGPTSIPHTTVHCALRRQHAHYCTQVQAQMRAHFSHTQSLLCMGYGRNKLWETGLPFSSQKMLSAPVSFMFPNFWGPEVQMVTEESPVIPSKFQSSLGTLSL